MKKMNRIKKPELEMNASFKQNQKVTLLIATRTEMGFTAVIDGVQEGILFKNEVFQPLKIGQKISGYVKNVRDDGKIDLCLQKPGYRAVDALSASIMYKLRHQKGFLAVTDKSRPEVIADLFGVSKKVFKKAIGNLYKNRLITLEEDGIRLKETRKKPVATPKKGRRGNGRQKGFKGKG
jgi:predicted RNA-binding protein (virulence factor B family)